MKKTFLVPGILGVIVVLLIAMTMILNQDNGNQIAEENNSGEHNNEEPSVMNDESDNNLEESSSDQHDPNHESPSASDNSEAEEDALNTLMSESIEFEDSSDIEERINSENLISQSDVSIGSERVYVSFRSEASEEELEAALSALRTELEASHPEKEVVFRKIAPTPSSSESESRSDESHFASFRKAGGDTIVVLPKIYNAVIYPDGLEAAGLTHTRDTLELVMPDDEVIIFEYEADEDRYMSYAIQGYDKEDIHLGLLFN